MKPIVRKPVSKHRSSKKFKHNVGRTKLVNLTPRMRGGNRL